MKKVRGTAGYGMVEKAGEGNSIRLRGKKSKMITCTVLIPMAVTKTSLLWQGK